MPITPPSDAEIQRRFEVIDRWLKEQMVANPVVDTVEADVHHPRAWYVRLLGDEKQFSTVWFQLRQRTLHAETYFMPAPQENEAELYAYLLRRNARMIGGRFVIGPEEAVYLYCQLDNTVVGIETLPDELDRILGSIYQWVEQFFRPALRIGYASRFAADQP